MIGKRRNHSRSGFTLIEMMIVVAILGVLFGVGANILTAITRFSRVSEARLTTQNNSRLALEEMNKAMRQASASTVVISQLSGQPPASSIYFSTIDGRSMKFYQEGSNLRFIQATSTRTLCSDLRFLSFMYPRTDNSKIISVSLTFQKSTYQGGAKALQMAIEKVRIMND